MRTLQSSIDAIATVAGIPLGGFQTITGGGVAADVEKDRLPGERYPTPIPGSPDIANITISRTYDETRDGALVPRLDKLVGNGEGSVGRVIRDRNQNPVGMRNYTCLLVRCTGPDGDTNSNSKPTLELEFAVSGLA
jgi:hypothetical protein